MRPDLRIATEFNGEIAAKYGIPGLVKALIIDDAANLLHTVDIEYATDDSDPPELFRRLNYTITAMQTNKKVLVEQNEMAQQLLYKIATSLSGSTLLDRPFEKGMFILPNDETWDDVLPTDKRPAAKKPAAKKPAAKKPEGGE